MPTRDLVIRRVASSDSARIRTAALVDNQLRAGDVLADDRRSCEALEESPARVAMIFLFRRIAQTFDGSRV
jgi:hypothetical protein